jgi:glycosyltransferase involved in cell wall biosynthesis
MKKVLVVARVFPPFRSVGHSIRMVKFIKYLPSLGWLPSVLTIKDRQEYEADRKQGSEALLAEVPREVSIYRTAAGEPSWQFLEKERAFGRRNWLTKAIVKILGGARRWGFRTFLVPDRCLLWLPFALGRGRQIVTREGIDLILATCPPHSATLVGACLKVLTRKRLILDFRDDWIDTPWYQGKPAIVRFVNRRMERWAVKHADRVVLVTEWSRKAFLERYPTEPHEKFVLVSNGCDLEEFPVLDPLMASPRHPRFTILHAGTLNDSKNWARTPAPVFQALHSLLQREPSLSADVSLAFTGFLPVGQRQLVKDLDLSAVVTELGFLPRTEFIRFMQACDLLVVINYEGCATLIPGKIYEYWAVGGPPILLLSCPGAAGSLVEQHSLGITVDPSDVAAIEAAILAVYRQSRSATPMRVKTAGIEPYDRKALTRQLAQLLSTVAAPQS